MRISAIISVFIASLLVGCENMGGFSKEQIGTTTGAVLGGIAGSFIGDGKGKWVAAETECRVLEYRINTGDGQSETSSFEACKAADGAWELG
jgi:surface antigen